MCHLLRCAIVSQDGSLKDCFVVSLVAASPEGCPGFAIGTVRVTESLVNRISDSQQSLQGIMVFPNPASETLFVRLEQDTPQPVALELFDLPGRIVRRAVFSSHPSGLLQMDVAGLPAGLYFLAVKTPGSSGVWKMIKEN